MTENSQNTRPTTPKIVVRPDGSYHVYGNVPLVHKTQVVSEYGEPLTWKKDFVYETKEHYSLCRCGASKEMPFCDSTHHEIDFDGTETADTGTVADRQIVDESGTGLVVKKDGYLCMLSGFCGNRLTNIDRMIADTAEPRVRAEIIAMIERCPAGAYMYSMKKGEENIEPDLPVEIAVTTEITEDGPINGPLWVTGNIPIERSDGEPFETRNRVTLCNCGHSCQKPLCDGSHREMQQKELRHKRKEKEDKK
jgi:CDGSH-type Zn-finger protein